ncbi:juvenile hormone acid O-methyltransferase-like [Cataglyphis hispanica]|uniref:juvenile hormone acid O-methyltransferase-like n=1 Tax=Cataglyphis hispanica TaxID=1086592 RepID=UPI00217FD255|nr:juvenile hormone acid O-methyltransferase-like [Cataglyphis hispanica]
MNPKEYASSNMLQRSNVSNLIDEFEEELIQISGKCMDVGCGPGDITKDILLPALNPNAVILGTDISEDMIEFAKKTHGSNKRLKFEVLDIQTKNLPKKYISGFDYIFSFYTLHWCYDIRQAFENIYDMLRPGGNILVNLVAFHDIHDIMNNLLRDIRFAPYIHDIKNYTAPYNNSSYPHKELKNILKNIGFKVCHCSLRETAYSSKDSGNFISSILSVCSFLNKMPHHLIEEYKNKLTCEFLKKRFFIKQHRIIRSKHLC